MSLKICLSLILICFLGLVWGHARLMSPPSRSSMWRLGFPTPINFNDNQLYCGGMTIQWQKNGGKCGICGDPYNMPHPRENEAGGKYGLGIISERYTSGEVIDVIVDVTTNHRGYFEFKLCPNNNPRKEASQECLDKHILKEAHGSGSRYYLGDKTKGGITLKLQLPKGFTCSQCVLQWTYVAGNNWGKCGNGISGMGCGPQETFRGCADIAIHKEGDVFDVKPNEIDVESKHNEIPATKNKNNDHNKGITNAKLLTYNYEVSKQTRQNSSTTNIVGNHNHSHHESYSIVHPESDNILSRTPENPVISTKNVVMSGESGESRPQAGRSTNRRRIKYNDRRFYHFTNKNPSSAKNPFDENWEFLMNNNRWPQIFAEIKSKRGKNQLKKKHDSHKSKYSNTEIQFKQIKLPLGYFSGSEEDVSQQDGFYLGGRRYKDFWLL